MKYLLLLALSASLLLASSAAASSQIAVKPSAGASGTTFVIAFTVPSAAPAGALDVSSRVSAAQTRAHNCVASIDFHNPKAVIAHAPLKFSFTPVAAHELCTGPWTVTVASAGKLLLGGGHFTLR
jgi:hypothetical protein